MTTQPAEQGQPPATHKLRAGSAEFYQAARHHAGDATTNLVREFSTVQARPAPIHGQAAAEPDVEPLDGLRAALELERAAGAVSHRYCRAAREAGHSWHDIGRALELPPATTTAPGESIAEAAYRYANPHGTRYARTYHWPFIWTCPTCRNTIQDFGPASHPARDEHGHDPGCPRLRHTIQAHQAGREPAPGQPGQQHQDPALPQRTLP